MSDLRSRVRAVWVVGAAAVLLLAFALGVLFWPSGATAPAAATAAPPALPEVLPDAADASTVRTWHVHDLSEMPEGMKPGDMVIVDEMTGALTREQVQAQLRAEGRKFREAADDQADPIPEGAQTGALVVTAKRPAGGPAVGVKITAHFHGERSAATGFLRGGSHRTDAEGTARWPRLPVGKWGVQAEVGRQTSTSTDVEVIDGTEAHVEFEVSEHVVVRGKVVNADGAPVEGASVQAVLGLEVDSRDELSRGAVVTDADGSFEIEDLTRSPYFVLASHPTLGAGRVRVGAPQDGVVVKLASGAIVFGSVSAPARPVQAYRVTLYAVGGSLMFEQLGDLRLDDGAPFEFKAPVPEGKYEVDLDADGRKLQKQFDVGKSDRRVEVRFEFPRGKAIEGSVVDQRGKPLEGAHLSLTPDTNDDDSRQAETGSDGRFAIEGLTAPEYHVHALKTGYTQTNKTLRVAAGSKAVVVSLHAKGKLKGRVVDASGRPVPKFNLGSVEQRSANGQFELDFDEDDPWLALSVGDSAGTVRQLSAKAGQTVDLGDVVVAAVPELVVAVLDATTGAPQAGLHLGLYARKDDGLFGVAYSKGPTDAQGKVRLPAVLGPGLIAACPYLACEGELAVPPGSMELVFKVKRMEIGD